MFESEVAQRLSTPGVAVGESKSKLADFMYHCFEAGFPFDISHSVVNTYRYAVKHTCPYQVLCPKLCTPTVAWQRLSI